MKKRAIFHNIAGALSNFLFLFLTGIVLLPFYFRYVSSSDYGTWLGGISFLSLASVLEANISFILTQQLGEKWIAGRRSDFAGYLGAAVLFAIAAGILIIGSTWLFRYDLVSWVSGSEDERKVFGDSFFLYSISLALTILFGYMNSVTQVFLRTLMTPVFNLLAALAGIIYTVLAVPGQGILALAGGTLVKSALAALLVMVYAVVLLREYKIPVVFRPGYLLELLGRVTWPFFSKIAMTAAVSIQNFIVAATISAGATTVFDVTRKLPLTMQMLMNMITVSTFTSFSLLYAGQKEGTAGHEQTHRYFAFIRVFLMVSLAIIFMTGGDFIAWWVGADKFGGHIILGLLCLTALFDQVRLMLAQQYTAMGRFNLTSATDAVFAVSFLLLALALIPGMHLYGIVMAGLAANMVYLLAVWFAERNSVTRLVPAAVNPGLLADLALAGGIATTALLLRGWLAGDLPQAIAILSLSSIILVVVFALKDKTLLLAVFRQFFPKPVQS